MRNNKILWTQLKVVEYHLITPKKILIIKGKELRIYIAFPEWTIFPGNQIALGDKNSKLELENQHFAMPKEMTQTMVINEW